MWYRAYVIQGLLWSEWRWRRDLLAWSIQHSSRSKEILINKVESDNQP